MEGLGKGVRVTLSNGILESGSGVSLARCLKVMIVVSTPPHSWVSSRIKEGQVPEWHRTVNGDICDATVDSLYCGVFCEGRI